MNCANFILQNSGHVISILLTFQQNHHLEKLDISWNGFHLTGAATISYAFTMNNILLELNISCNRLTDACAQCLIKGLENNSTLTVLRVSMLLYVWYIIHRGQDVTLVCVYV